MMSQSTGIRILKSSVRMTGRGVRTLSALKQLRKSHAYGDKKTYAEAKHILPWEGQYGLGIWFDSHASNAEKKSPSLIMRITTNLLRLYGFVIRATSNDTKKLKKLLTPKD